MPNFFISYDRDDRPLTRQLAAQLRRVYGYNEVWFDENIYGGEHWWEEIRQQIARCDIFMFLLSDESANSPYCEKERAEAERLRKPILPVRISTIQNIPPQFQDIQYVDMSEGQITVENFTELNAAIRQISQRMGRLTRDTKTIVVNKRSRNRVLIAVIPLLVVVLLVILVMTAPQQPFQGELSYASGRSSILISQGGLGGAINQVLGRNPWQVSAAVAADTRLVWSPDKSQVAYTGRAGGNSEVFVISSSGGTPQNLTNNAAEDADPDWSGNKITFATNRDGNFEIYMMGADGSNPINLSNSPGDDLFPAWSPDGDQIAFASNRDGDYEIYIMTVDGQDVFALTDNEVDDLAPAWSPDGLQLAFESNRVRKGGPGNVPGSAGSESARNWDIYVADIDGEGASALTRSPGDDRHPAWSLDGKQLAFVSDRSGSEDLYLKNVADKTKDILLAEGVEGFPAWRS